MTFSGVNPTAILLATTTSFLFGGVWYGMLSTRWMRAAKIDLKHAEVGNNMQKAMPFFVCIAALLVMSLFLAGLMGHLGATGFSARVGAITGAAVWFGFVLTSLGVNHAFQGAPRDLTLIDGGHWLGVLVIQGAIIGWMGL